MHFSILNIIILFHFCKLFIILIEMLSHLDQVGEVLQKGIRVIGHVVHAVNKSLMHFLVVFLAAHGEDCFEFCIVHLLALQVVLLAL